MAQSREDILSISKSHHIISSHYSEVVNYHSKVLNSIVASQAPLQENSGFHLGFFKLIFNALFLIMLLISLSLFLLFLLPCDVYDLF